MNIFITGITGTLGTALAQLHHARGDSVSGCARGESRAVEWLRKYPEVAEVVIGDASKMLTQGTEVRRSAESANRIYHCAALKHVDVCEKQPLEAMRQNLYLTDVVSLMCELNCIDLVFISTDKACLPGGVYGATKLLGERLVTSRGGAAVRLGNLAGSSGSVLALWKQEAAAGRPIKLSDPEMTRYFMTVRGAALFTSHMFEPGKVVAPFPLRAARMGEIAGAMSPNKIIVTGARPGDQKHQWLVAPGEKVAREDGRFIIGEGEPVERGLTSEYALKWDSYELLQSIQEDKIT